MFQVFCVTICVTKRFLLEQDVEGTQKRVENPVSETFVTCDYDLFIR